MKRLIIKMIQFYQKLPFRSHYCCKYYPTCSNYTIEAINTYGIIKGSYFGIRRILRCNPFHKGGYDPLIKEKKI